MDIYTIDFETYYSATHSLTKINPIEYVTHPDTEIISLSIKKNGEPSDVHLGSTEVRKAISTIDWSNAMVIGHNLSGFDALILAWIYGIKPKLWGCTLAMARPIYGKQCQLSLAALCEYLGLGVKNVAALHNFKGKHFDDLTGEDLFNLRAYNGSDTDLCYKLFKHLGKFTPARELKLIDLTIRMLTEPKFELDSNLLQKTLSEERVRKSLMLLDIATAVGAYKLGMTDEETEEATRKILASSAKFSEVLTAYNVPIPLKPSPSNPDKKIPALSKTDKEFINLQKHKDPLIVAAAQARLGVKSTILETRIEAFIKTAKCLNGKLPVPLAYYGADTTGRWAGLIYNMQNLPRIGKNPTPSDALRNSLRAPKGHKIIVVDLSGIELRINMFLWKVPYAMELFKADPENADLYTYFAAHSLYDIEESTVISEQRQVGKVCVSEETLVYCKYNNKIMWVQIKDVKSDYQLWDGEEWVWAQGVVSNGWKQTQKLCGVSLTPDHLVLSGTKWKEAKYVQGENLALALERGAENLPLLDMWRGVGTDSLRLLLSATVAFLNIRLKRTTSKISKLLDVIHALKKPLEEKDIGNILQPCQMMNIGRATWIDFLLPSPDVTTLKTLATITTGKEAYQYAKSGDKIDLSFLNISKRCLAGISQSSKLIGLTLIKGMNRVILGFVLEEIICLIKGKYLKCRQESQNLKQNSHVYDVLNCGPRNRFTILTNRGPIIVHNCHLGLGFGAGAATFQAVAENMAKIAMSDMESKNVVDKYRQAHPEIVQGWKTCHNSLNSIYTGATANIDPWGLCYTTPEGIKTPQGIIRYPKLRQETTEGKTEWVYGEGRHKSRIYAGKVDENIVQHLGREILADNVLEVQKRYKIALLVHDEICIIVPESEAEEALQFVLDVTKTSPKWWPELVVSSKGGIGDTYGEAK